MKKIYPDLWQTTMEKQFSSLNAYAYILEHPQGNVMFYNPHSTNEFGKIAAMGGIAHNLLSHCHEVNNTLAETKHYFGSKLCCHARVKPYLDNNDIVADWYFDTPAREFYADDIDVIHTPGHTDNNLCFHYQSPHGKRYLFTGDTLYLHNGRWNILVIESEGGGKDALCQSLLLLRELDVDVVICSLSIGEYQVVEVDKTEWNAIVDPLIRRLQRKRAE